MFASVQTTKPAPIQAPSVKTRPASDREERARQIRKAAERVRQTLK